MEAAQRPWRAPVGPPGEAHERGDERGPDEERVDEHREREPEGVTTVLQRAYRKVNALNPLSYTSGSREMPNLFDLVMNTIQTLQHELGAFKAVSADVRIDCDLSEFTWIEFYRPAELIARGREAAEQAVPEIRRVLAERVAAGRP